MSLFSKLTGIKSTKSNKPIKNVVDDEKKETFFQDIEDDTEDNYFHADIDANSKKSKKNSSNKKNLKKIKTDKQTDEWEEENYEEEGELTIDVFQDTENNIIIKSTIAGVKPEDIDISVNGDMLTIRGKRELEETIDKDDFYYKECYWGNFSRSIILPCEIKADKITAKLKNGVLTVKLPKTKAEKKVAIKVVEE
ncbi:Hsp20/alpha crystallin family protein [Patescibacteria group bacterium]